MQRAETEEEEKGDHPSTAVVPPRLLELFSGTGSIGTAFKAQGWEVTSVDSDPRAHATVHADIAGWDCSALRGQVDVIWASPPCTMYSVARRGSTDEERAASDKLVRRTLEIVEALGNPPLFIENLWTGRLKNRGLLNHLKLHVVDYCKYGMPYRKRTAIWTNTDWTPERRLCKHDCASSRGGKHLARAQQGGPGPSFTQRQLYRIPAELCDEIARTMMDVVHHVPGP